MAKFLIPPADEAILMQLSFIYFFQLITDFCFVFLVFFLNHISVKLPVINSGATHPLLFLFSFK